ncbi:MAG: hypothetical protein ACD_62C00266G0003 [uncultured bacterium]|nr:MAG: hypothetical protein ACD_62C00266G0003 [uncultured bacterium]
MPVQAISRYNQVNNITNADAKNKVEIQDNTAKDEFILASVNLAQVLEGQVNRLLQASGINCWCLAYLNGN